MTQDPSERRAHSSPSPPDADSPSSELDHARLLAEIEAEVAERRARGEIPPGLEEELGTIFDRFAPPGYSGRATTTDLLDEIERVSFLDVAAPTASARPGVPQVKKLILRATAWELQHLAAGVGVLGSAVRRALDSVVERVERLELATAAADPAVRRLLDQLPPVTASVPSEAVLAALSGIEGRVGHLGAGQGELVEAMGAAGFDAYGVEPDQRLVADGSELVRHQDPREHLARVADGRLAALVVSLPSRPVGELAALVGEARRCLAPGGLLLAPVEDPERWAERLDPVRAELWPVRPLSGAAWALLVRSQGFGLVDEGAELVVGRRPER